MDKEQYIILLLICIILIICYFAPNTDTFSNVYNPQGSYVNPHAFNQGSSVETWKLGNVVEPGRLGSLNMSSIQSQFPYNHNLPENYNDGDIGLIKSDGVIVGGYMPQIIRPFDTVTANPSKGSNCNWPCYSDKKHQKWCSEENAMKYHAMRPLVSPSQYNENLRKLMKGIIDKEGPFNTGPDNTEYTTVFCTESQKSIMDWLMSKIALQVTKMPEMQRNGSWKYEMFYYTDVQMYQFVNSDSTTYFKIIFNLFNPLRSVSSMVYATVYMKKEKPNLVDMDFVNKGLMTDYMAAQNGYGPINGHNINPTFESVGGGTGFVIPKPLGYEDSPEGQKSWEDNFKKNPNEFDWNYMNTLEVQKFNRDGFYSNIPEENVKIEGGIPESIKRKLAGGNCENTNLMACVIPAYTGIMENGDPTPINGDVKNVYGNSIVFSDRKVETLNNTVYV